MCRGEQNSPRTVRQTAEESRPLRREEPKPHTVCSMRVFRQHNITDS